VELRTGLHLVGRSEGLVASSHSVCELLGLHGLLRHECMHLLLVGDLDLGLVKAWLADSRKICMGLEVWLGGLVIAHWDALSSEARREEGLLRLRLWLQVLLSGLVLRTRGHVGVGP